MRSFGRRKRGLSFLILLGVVGLACPEAISYGQTQSGGAKSGKANKSTGTALRQEKATQDMRGLELGGLSEMALGLPKSWDAAHGVLQGSVSESHTLDSARDQQTVNKLANAKNDVVYEEANQAVKSNNPKLAAKLYEMLCEKQPKDARYFYGAAIAYSMQGNSGEAFANSMIAYHLDDSPIYRQFANSLVSQLQKEADPCFKLTWGYAAHDGGIVVNAGVRLWKIGLTQSSIKLFEYAIKHEPLYAAIAAYDLGATAEKEGNFKLASQYYKWAAAQSHNLEAQAARSPQLYAEISKTFKQLPTYYIEQAYSDVQGKLKGHVSQWFGWPQAATRPKVWGSEVCPLCAISRTRPDYESMQMEFRP